MEPPKVQNTEVENTISETPVVAGPLNAPESPVTTTGALPIMQSLDQAAVFYPDVMPPQPVANSQHHLKVYKNNSKLRTFLLVGFLAALLIGFGLLAWSLKQRDDRSSFQQQALNGELSEESEKQGDQNVSTSLLTVNTNLTVNGSSILQGNTILGGNTSVSQNLIVKGATSLTMLQVTGDGSISGQLTVNGTVIANNLQGNLTGNVTGTFSGNVTGTFAGTSTGSFNGTYVGNGAGLTNINATNCGNCVQLQGSNSVDQSGNVALAGNIRARKISLREAVNATDTFTVQTATGENIISADTLNQNIRVADLLPQLPSSITPGSYTPAHRQYNSVTSMFSAGAGQNGVAMAQGPDGFGRIAYDNAAGDAVMFSRCLDADCVTHVDTVVANGSYAYDMYLAMTIGQDGFARIAYNNGAGLELVVCKNTDCTVSVVSQVDAGSAGGAGIGIDITPAGLVRLAYPDFEPGTKTFYTACNDIDCTAPVRQDLGTNWWGADLVDMTLGQDGFARIVFVADQAVLKFVQCHNSSCSSNTTTVLPDEGSAGANGVVIRMGADGLPRIMAHHADATGSIHFMRCVNADCSSRTDTVVDTGEFTTNGLMMTLGLDGFARLFYADDIDRSLQMSRCTNDDCSTFVQTQIDSANSAGDSGVGVYVGSDGFVRAAYRGAVGGDLMFTRLTAPDAYEDIPIIIVATAVDHPGSAIGTATDRFGQIFASQMNLQTASTTAGLIVNQTGPAGLQTASGPVASFQINGTERLKVGATGAVSVGDAGLLQESTAASFNLVAGPSDTTDLMHAYDTTGNVVFRMGQDGSIAAGAPATCAGCLPTAVVNSVSLSGVASDMSVYGNYVYVTGSGTGIELATYDVSNALSPLLTNRPITGRSSLSNFVAQGSYGYLATSAPTSRLVTYDLSNPAKPREIGALVVANPGLYEIVIKNQYLYLVGNGGLYVYDITSPAAPVLATFLALGLSGNGNVAIAIEGNTAFVKNNSENQLFSVDISNPASPVQLYSLPLATGNNITRGMVAHAGMLYLGCMDYYYSCSQYQNRKLMMVDISNPAQPVAAGSVDLGDAGSTGWYTQKVGNYLYVTTGARISTFDISSPATPVLKDTRAVSPTSVFTVVGDAMYTAHSLSPVISVLARVTTASFQNLQTTVLKVDARLEVAGVTNLNSTTTVAGGANLIVASVPSPLSTSQYFSNDGGSLSGSSAITHYFRVTALVPGAESAPVNVTQLGSAMQTISSPFNDTLAAVGTAGSLTGTYRYKYTYVTPNGETTVQGSTPASVTVAGQRVDLSDIRVPSDPLTAINIYRCTMPGCATYNLVGSIPSPTPEQTITYTDDNPTPGAAAPGSNTARTNTNKFNYNYNKTLLPANTTAIRVYHSTDNINYTSQDFPVTGYVGYAGGGGAIATAPTKSSSGRLGVGTGDPTATLHVVGDTLLQSGVNSTATFQIQNSAGAVLMTADTVNQRVGIGIGTPLASLHISAAGTGGSLFRITDTTATARDVLDIADTGITTFRNQTDSTSAFRVQNAAGTTTVFAVNTTNLRVEIASGSDLKFMGAGNTRNAITKDYTCTATEVVNDVVIVSGVATVARTTTANSNRVAGVVVTKPNATTCTIAIGGSVQVNFGANGNPAAIGDPVTTSATTGMAQSNATPAAGAVLGKSMSNKDGSNLVWILIRGN